MKKISIYHFKLFVKKKAMKSVGLRPVIIHHPLSHGNTKFFKISIVYRQGLVQVWEQIAYLQQSTSIFSITGILTKIELLGLFVLAFEM